MGLATRNQELVTRNSEHTMSGSWRDYPRLSRTPLYSLVFIVPLVVLYEALAVLINWDSLEQLRNGADVLIRHLLALFGLTTPYLIGILFAVSLLVAGFWQRRKVGSIQVSGAYMAGMLVESLLWAGVLLVSLSAVDRLLMVTTSDAVLRTAFLAVGAGLYEEGVFRLLLITGVAAFLRRIMDWQRQIALVIAVGVAAVLFSLFHYVGIAGETFTWNSFAYRSVAGAILGLLFIFRGFGITVYTHTAYDLMVLGLYTVG